MQIYQLKIYEGKYDDSPGEWFYFTFEGAQRGAEEWLTKRGYTMPSDFRQKWELSRTGSSWWNESYDGFTMNICPEEILH